MSRCVVAALMCSAIVTIASAQEAQKAPAPAGSLTDVTGVWTMLVGGHQIGLELEQTETMVEGVMLTMGQRILLVGEYRDRALTLKGERPEDGAPAGHGSGGSGAGPIVATMRDDGILEGELSTQRGRTAWTGERLKKP